MWDKLKIAAWHQRRVDSKLQFMSQNALPCQNGGPDPRAQEKRLKTCLYHHIVTQSDRKTRRGADDDEEAEKEKSMMRKDDPVGHGRCTRGREYREHSVSIYYICKPEQSESLPCAQA